MMEGTHTSCIVPHNLQRQTHSYSLCGSFVSIQTASDGGVPCWWMCSGAGLHPLALVRRQHCIWPEHKKWGFCRQNCIGKKGKNKRLIANNSILIPTNGRTKRWSWRHDRSQNRINGGFFKLAAAKQLWPWQTMEFVHMQLQAMMAKGRRREVGRFAN